MNTSEGRCDWVNRRPDVLQHFGLYAGGLSTICDDDWTACAAFSRGATSDV